MGEVVGADEPGECRTEADRQCRDAAQARLGLGVVEHEGEERADHAGMADRVDLAEGRHRRDEDRREHDGGAAAGEGRQRQSEGEGEFNRAGGAHVEGRGEAERHVGMRDEEGIGPAGIGPLLHRGPHQRDGEAPAQDVERACAEDRTIEPDGGEVDRDAEEDRIVGEVECAVVDQRDREQGHDAERGQRQRAFVDQARADGELEPRDRR